MTNVPCAHVWEETPGRVEMRGDRGKLEVLGVYRKCDAKAWAWMTPQELTQLLASRGHGPEAQVA